MQLIHDIDASLDVFSAFCPAPKIAFPPLENENGSSVCWHILRAFCYQLQLLCNNALHLHNRTTIYSYK